MDITRCELSLQSAVMATDINGSIFNSKIMIAIIAFAVRLVAAILRYALKSAYRVNMMIEINIKVIIVQIYDIFEKRQTMLQLAYNLQIIGVLNLISKVYEKIFTSLFRGIFTDDRLGSKTFYGATP